MTRYRELLDRLQREPDWIEFMNPETGGLLTVEELRAESAVARGERVGKMKALIGERAKEIERVALSGGVG